jgi:hypothetical protein
MRASPAGLMGDEKQGIWVCGWWVLSEREDGEAKRGEKKKMNKKIKVRKRKNNKIKIKNSI